MTSQEVAKVAAEANVDARTVERALDGRGPRSAALRTAIHGALVLHGFSKEAMRLERAKMHTAKRKVKK